MVFIFVSQSKSFMITESKVTENFCIADDFCKEFEIEMAKDALASTSISSAIFKHYYLGCVCQHRRHLFPKTFSYNRFVELIPRCFIALAMFPKLVCFGKCSGISFWILCLVKPNERRLTVLSMIYRQLV